MLIDNVQVKTVGLGLNLDTPFSPITGKVAINTGTSRINQSLGIIFDTDNGEVPMIPLLGGNLSYLVFSPNDEAFADLLAMRIESIIEEQEPRIDVINITVTPDEHEARVTIEYYIRNTNIAGVFDYTLTNGNGGDTTNG